MALALYTVAVPTHDDGREYRERLGSLLRRARDARGYSQTAAGEWIGKSRTTIGDYEAGIEAPRADDLFVLIEKLGIRPEMALNPPAKPRVIAEDLADYLIDPGQAERQADLARGAAALAPGDLEAEQAAPRAAANERDARRRRRPA